MLDDFVNLRKGFCLKINIFSDEIWIPNITPEMN